MRELDDNGGARSSADRPSAVLTVFTVAWAVAALFHLWLTPHLASLLSSPSSLAVSHLGIAGAAVWALLRPWRPVPLLALAIVEVWSVYLEAPVLGNHWLLIGLVDLVLLAGGIDTYLRRRLAPDALSVVALPAARWTLLAFYTCAAFAKVNSGFLDPAVSCATYFTREAATSWGFDLRAVDRWPSVLPVLVAGIELAIPLLLLGTTTRHAGVLVGVTFHVIIALDRAHPFFDFSTALIGLLVLFLPGSFAQWVTEGAARIRAASAPAGPATGVGLALGIVVVAVAEVARRGSVRPLLAQGPEILWYAYGGGALALIIAFLSRRPAPDPGLLRLPRRWLAAVPLLAFLNGITPYLEVKTGYSFNMYSNLVTRGGRSNHLLVRRTLPLTERHADLVRIISSSDRRLQRYSDEEWDLPWLLFRDYLSRHPGVAVHYERKGQRHDLARAADDPSVVESVPSWERRLFAYRLVDRRDPPRCQTTYQAAR